MVRGGKIESMTDINSPVDPIAKMLDTLGVGMCLFDTEDRAISWNATFLRLFPEHDGHVQVGEPYACNLRRFYQVRLDAARMAHIDRFIADGLDRHRRQFQPFEFFHHGQWLRVASRPIEGVGRMRLWTVVPPPVAGDELARAIAAGGTDLQPGAFADIADGLMVCDAGGRITYANRRFAMIYELNPGTPVAGETFADFLSHLWHGHPGREQALLALSDNANFAGAPFEIELPGDRWVRVIEHRAIDGGGVSTHIDFTEVHRSRRDAEAARDRAEALAVSLRQEIDDRQRAEEALRRTQRAEAVGQLTAGVAHDFNNLFAIVLGNLELIDLTNPEPKLHRRLEVIRATIERGATLTGQLLAFARRQPLVPRPVDLKEMTGAMLPLLRTACGRRIEIVDEMPDHLPFALVDPAQLELAVLNLALNARDAMPDGGTLRIGGGIETVTAASDHEAPEAGAYVVLRVEDNGMGMTDAVRSRAIEPYFTTKGQKSGSGLGLSHAYGLARQSGGTIAIASEPGKGTVVRLLLPAVDALAADPPRTATTPAAPKYRVLLVDDDLEVLAGTTELLEIVGFEVTAVSSAAQARQALEGGLEIDVLATDVMMPEMNGPDLARWVWARDPRLPVLFITGFAAPETIEGLGSNCMLLRKPCRSKELRDAILTLLGEGEGASLVA